MIDAFVKVTLVGIELLSVESRVVIASVETHLKYVEAIGLTAAAATPAQLPRMAVPAYRAAGGGCERCPQQRPCGDFNRRRPL